MKRLLLISAIVFVAIGCKGNGTGGSGAAGGGGGGGAGGGSTSIGITCQEFKDFSVGCFDKFCLGEGSAKPFCGCWKQQKKDIDTQSCQCVPLDLDTTCAQTDLESIRRSDLSCEPVFEVLRGACSL